MSDLHQSQSKVSHADWMRSWLEVLVPSCLDSHVESTIYNPEVSPNLSHMSFFCGKDRPAITHFSESPRITQVLPTNALARPADSRPKSSFVWTTTGHSSTNQIGHFLDLKPITFGDWSFWPMSIVHQSWLDTHLSWNFISRFDGLIHAHCI